MMEKQVQFLIYGLCDPRTEELRYIGRSSTGLRRAKFHSFPSTLIRDGNPHKVNWIRLLQSQGLQPKIVMLEKCASSSDLPEAERRLIAQHKASGRLLNATEGGEGSSGHKQSPETIAKRVAKIRGRKQSFETRARISASCQGRSIPRSSATKAKTSASLTGRTLSAEHRKNLSIAMREAWSR